MSLHVFHPGETAAVESETVFCHLFSRFPAELFNEPMLAYEFVWFCLHNVSVLQEKVPMYRHSFPNLLKVTSPFLTTHPGTFDRGSDAILFTFRFVQQFLAWNSPGLISEYMELLPSLLAPETAIELLHTLLDLPCLAAALDLQHRLVRFGN